ncbi:hypothetical protein CRN39_19055 [Vibrio vulnificus]|nr:hypothetical protein CRN39_19055 [Vibrio vulnificus]
MDILCLFNDIFLRMAISFLLEAAAVLAAFVHTNHIGYLCSWDSLICRLPATSTTRNFKWFGYILYFVAKIKTVAQGDGFIRHCLRRLSGVFC